MADLEDLARQFRRECEAADEPTRPASTGELDEAFSALKEQLERYWADPLRAPWDYAHWERRAADIVHIRPYGASELEAFVAAIPEDADVNYGHNLFISAALHSLAQRSPEPPCLDFRNVQTTLYLDWLTMWRDRFQLIGYIRKEDPDYGPPEIECRPADGGLPLALCTARDCVFRTEVPVSPPP
ncbi:hypothetical protein J4439_04240 [Candidatus Woesearchaeota archaeon]|nr:hypothetical protein [Candidatus Woesearchaeota archaeon]